LAACGKNSNYCGNTDCISAHADTFKSTKTGVRNGAAMGWLKFIPAVKRRLAHIPP
jgi:hypothetical protein